MSTLNTDYSSIPTLLSSAFSATTPGASGPLPTTNPLSSPDFVLAGSLSSLLPTSSASAITSALPNILYGQDIANLVANPSVNGTLNTPTSYFENLLQQLSPNASAASNSANSTATSPASTSAPSLDVAA